MELTVECIITEGVVAEALNTQMIARKLSGRVVGREGKRIAVIEGFHPGTTVVARDSGRITIGGLQTMVQTRKLLRGLLRKILDCGEGFNSNVQLRERELIASSQLDAPISIEAAGKELAEMVVEIRPSDIPALLLRPTEEKTTVLLFDSGKMVIFNAQSLSRAKISAELVRRKLGQ